LGLKSRLCLATAFTPYSSSLRFEHKDDGKKGQYCSLLRVSSNYQW
jgi:hypothetical protein